MKKYAVLSCLIFVSLILAACQMVTPNPTVPAVETEDPGQQSTLESLLTEQAATIESLSTLVAPTASSVPTETEVPPEPTAIPEVTVIPVYTGEFTVIESGGLVFKLPAEVAASAEVTTVLADDPNQGWSEFALPARRMVSFTGYAISDHFHNPVIYVYDFDKLIQGGAFGSTMAATLQGLLTDPEFDLQAEGSLPFLPPFNAAQVFHVLEQRLDSDHNSGIRYLTLYSQALVGVVNYDIFYTYQGISKDGRYYIAAILPINSTLLSNDQLTQAELETIAIDYEAYLSSMTDMIRGDNGASLSPTLAALDAMMMSLFSQD
ncbi:MAG TPA: hypothetical protein PKY64_02880 [Anaerolineaceae bacterium]|nr:hypothetical protein [Anaerolineaceae bacterium]